MNQEKNEPAAGCRPLSLCLPAIFFFSAGNAEGGQRPEAEGYGPAEEDMVPHADDSKGHDHEHAAKAHGLGEAVLSMAVIFPAQDALGKEGAKECQSAGNAYFRRHIQVHIMGMEDEHSFFLNEKIIIGIGKKIGPPAYAQERMFLNHGHRTFPQSEAEVHRRIFAGEKGKEPFHYLAVIEGQHHRHQKEEESEPFVIKKSKPQHNGCQAHPGSPGIGESQAEKEGKKNPCKDSFPFHCLLSQGKSGEDTDHHQQIGAKKIGVFKGRVHAPPKEGKTFRVHPALGFHIRRHSRCIGILEEAVGHGDHRPCQESIQGLFLFFLRGNGGINQKIQQTIHEGLQCPVHQRKGGVLRYKGRKEGAKEENRPHLP